MRLFRMKFVISVWGSLSKLMHTLTYLLILARPACISFVICCHLVRNSVGLFPDQMKNTQVGLARLHLLVCSSSWSITSLPSSLVTKSLLALVCVLIGLDATLHH